MLFAVWLFGGIFLGGFKSPLIYISVPIISIAIYFLLVLFIKHVKEQEQLKAKQKAQEEERRRMKELRGTDIDSMEGIMFEKYIAALLDHRGFTTTVTKGSGDFGVDIVASKDNQRYAVQVKRHRSNVPRTAVSDAIGGLNHYGCNGAMVITNSYFSRAAIDLARTNRCILVNRDVLEKWINDFQTK